MNRFVIADPKLCIGCYTCEVGCVEVHVKVGLVGIPRLTVTHTVAGTMPMQCRHCDDAPCEQVCPVKAITFEDRSIQLNESVCIGCKMCALACPFGVITPYGALPQGETSMTYGGFLQPTPAPVTETPVHALLAWTVGQRTVAVKCDLCHFLPEGPECIRVCPTNALRLVDEETVITSNAERRAASVEAIATGDGLALHHPGL
ncbi:MAG: 4Fe-4S dicluster domain-containing protein [Methylocella sp.]